MIFVHLLFGGVRFIISFFGFVCMGVSAIFSLMIVLQSTFTIDELTMPEVEDFIIF